MRGEDSIKAVPIVNVEETPPRAWRRCSFLDISRLYKKHLHVRGEDHVGQVDLVPLGGNTSTCVEKIDIGTQ